MSVQQKVFPPVNRPDAPDIDGTKILPKREFEVCNDLLNDRKALEAFYEENGYLFFRDVLDQDSVAGARNAMLDIAADEFGLSEKGDPEGKWTGREYPPMSEERSCFEGISSTLVAHPANQAVIAKVLGEEPMMVPIVQYRLYPPNGPVTVIHQDGFFSPGIHDYKPLWIPLVPCPREVGGLMIAVGHNQKGYLHNIARQPPYPLPADMIDPDSWATADFEPGDLLVVHPCSPHGSTPNRSDRLRVSFDTRVQSAKNPTTFRALVQSVTPQSVTVKGDDRNVGSMTLSLDPESFVRIRDYGRREEFSDFATVIEPGMDLVVVREEGRCAMLRRASPV